MRSTAPVFRATVFIPIAVLILSLLASFTAATFSHFTALPASITQGVALGLIGVFVAVIILSFRRQHLGLRVLGRISAVGVGFLFFALWAALVAWLVLGVCKLAGVTADTTLIAEVLYGGAALTTLYGVLNAANLRVTKYTVRLPHLPAAWQGREIALVTDLHVGNIRGAAFVRRVVQRLDQLKPAAVLIGGDMFDGAEVNIPESVAPWSTLHPPAGTYFVSGNHDEFTDRARYLAELAKVGVNVLNNQKVTVEGLQIIGVHDGETHHRELYRTILERVQINRAQPSILLAHQPAQLDLPEQAGVSLQLSGHTHFGQNWPLRLLVQRIYGRFAYGLNRLGALQVVTSSGAGSWGPPMRVGTVAEIVLLRLEVETDVRS